MVIGSVSYKCYKRTLTRKVTSTGTEPRSIAATSKRTAVLQVQESRLLREKKGGCSGRVARSFAGWTDQQSPRVC